MAVIEPAVTVRTLPVEPARLGTDSISEPSILAYNHAAERMSGMMDATWKACIALFLVVLVTWIAGLLPAAIKVL
jgi:hypothetical protein